MVHLVIQYVVGAENSGGSELEWFVLEVWEWDLAANKSAGVFGAQ